MTVAAKPAGINIAGSTAFHVAHVHKLTMPLKPYCRDMDFPNKPECCIITIDSENRCALVVYADNPRGIVSTGWHEGRFVPL